MYTTCSFCLCARANSMGVLNEKTRRTYTVSDSTTFIQLTSQTARLSFLASVCQSLVYLFTCLFVIDSAVSKSTDVKEPVTVVIERELKTLLAGKDLTQFNSDFLEKNSQSLLHRLSGKR